MEDLLIVEAHSDNSAISISGFLERIAHAIGTISS